MSNVTNLNLLLQQLELKDPFKSLLKPTLEFVTTPEGIDLKVTIDTFERDRGTPFKALESRHPLTEYWEARIRGKASNLASFVRIALLNTLEHELDESIWCDGVRIFEPKHWGPKDQAV